MTSALASTFAAIDAANGDDPSRCHDLPLAQHQGQRGSAWLARLAPDAGDELQLAVRAHHLRRWELARADFPTGRDGYLRWRRENKAHQASSLGELMSANAWPADSIERAKQLLARTKLRTDAETQTLEDAACLVFLETQFDDMNDRLDHDHMVSVVVKTLKKMSERAITLASEIDLNAGTQQVLADAVAVFSDPARGEQTQPKRP